MSKRKCEVCGRKAGPAPLNPFGEPDLSPDVPLGAVTKCPDCGLWSCPDCQAETECCEVVENRRLNAASPTCTDGATVDFRYPAEPCSSIVVMTERPQTARIDRAGEPGLFEEEAKA